MLTSVLVRLGLAVFSALPVERIIAALLNKWISKIDGTNIDKARRTAGHLAELSALFDDILTDKQVSPEEVGQMRAAVIRARERLMAAWASGADAKPLQKALGEQVNAAYAEPLLIGLERPDAGHYQLGCLLPLCLICSFILVCGCLTRTRCLQQSFDGCTFNVNEGENFENPSYPRSLQIGVQDQQVEGGSDSIASGNKTDPSLQVPMGDSALGYLGQLLGGLFKSKSAATDAAAPAVGTEAGAACSDGSCTAK